MERSAPKQRPISTQRSMSVMSINTTLAQNAYTPQLRRNNSVAQPRPRSIYSSEPVMAPDELTAKIADSFQQFSSMLNQMQKTTTHKKEHQSLHSPALSRPATPSPSRAGSIKHIGTGPFKDDGANKNTMLSPISLFSPPQPATVFATNNSLVTNPTASRQLPQDDSVFPLDSGQSQKDVPRTHNKKSRIVQDKLLVNRFLRAASNGDTSTVETLLHECRDLAYVADDDDDQGPTALIYAACFGHLATAECLLAANAPIDEQDKFGWTALMWATVNHHDTIVDMLLSKGAAPETQSNKGNTAFDFVLEGDTVMTQLLQPGSKFSRRHHVTVDRKVKRKKSQKLLLKTARRQSTPVIPTNTKTTTALQDTNGLGSRTPSFQHSGMDAYTHFMTTESTRHRLLTQRHELFHDTLLNASNGNDTLTTMTVDGNIHDDDDDDDNDGDADDMENQQHWAKYEASIRSSHTFVWDACLADQMFVFSMDHLNSILDVALDTKSLSKLTTEIHNKDEVLWMPANLLFLCARFACYYTGRDDLARFFQVTIGRLTKVAKQAAKDTTLLCYWMTNIYQLLNYLKRDAGLERSTKEQQRQLVDLMTDQYMLFIRDCERRLDKVIEPALLDYESIQDMLPVDFADSNDWSKFFQRRGSTRNSMDESTTTTTTNSTNSDGNNKGGNCGGPRTLITMLKGIQNAMTSVYELPGYMGKHTMVQCIFYVLCEGFNQLLANKKYLCRSKALHIRLNVSVLEEWARKYGHVNATYGVTGLERMTQLLQLLQCLSELGDGDAFESTCQELALLNAAQIKRCVSNYRYETQETQLPKHVEEWVAQWAQQQQQQQQSMADATGPGLDTNHYLGQLKCYLEGNDQTANQLDSDGSLSDRRDRSTSYMEGKGLFSIDPRSILPFNQPLSLPMLPPLNSTALSQQQNNVSSESIYLEIKQKAEQQKKETSIRIPTLPHKLLDRLDKKLHK